MDSYRDYRPIGIFLTQFLHCDNPYGAISAPCAGEFLHKHISLETFTSGDYLYAGSSRSVCIFIGIAVNLRQSYLYRHLLLRCDIIPQTAQSHHPALIVT